MINLLTRLIGRYWPKDNGQYRTYEITWPLLRYKGQVLGNVLRPSTWRRV